MNEGELQARIQLALGRNAHHARLFRNTVGDAWHGRVARRDGDTVLLVDARRVSFGLAPGSGDLVGWSSITVTADMVGQPVAVFTSAEVKTSTGRVGPLQRRWLDVVLAAGGVAGVVRSPDEAVRLVAGRAL